MMTLQHITEESLESRALQRHEPRWLRDERTASWLAFQKTPEINWKKSKTPNPVLNSSIRLDEPKAFQEVKIQKKTPENVAGKITFQDDTVLKASLSEELANKGVVFCDMQTAVLERADILEQHWFKKDKKDQLELLQAALWTNGYFLYVPSGVVIDQPFQVHIVQETAGKSLFFRNLIIADQRASIVIEEVLESSVSSEEMVLCSLQTSVVAEEASQVKCFSQQNWGNHIYDLSSREFKVKQNARLKFLLAMLGAQAGRSAIRGQALETGASVEHDGILIGGDQDRFKIIAEVEHLAKATEGLMRYKAILQDQSTSFLDGLIRVYPQSKHSSSRLEEHTLILSDKARCDALPALDIRTDEVQVSHSASISQVDSEKMFYLMSRGLSEAEAKNMIIQGFFESLLETIPDPAWYESLKSAIEFKLFNRL